MKPSDYPLLTTKDVRACEGPPPEPLDHWLLVAWNVHGWWKVFRTFYSTEAAAQEEANGLHCCWIHRRIAHVEDPAE